MSDNAAVDELLKAEANANEVIKAAYQEKDRKTKEARV